MKKTLLAALIAVLCLSLASCSGNSGKLEKAGKINIVVLKGTYREMGEQYGSLLKDELNANYNGIVKGVQGLEGLTLADMRDFGSSIYANYPQKYKEIVNGLARSSGLGLEKAKVLTAQELYIGLALADMFKKKSGCTGMATWGDYSSGPLVFGRNYDLGPVNHQYATLVVYNPTDGSIPVASWTFAGCIYVTSGMNSSGVFLELNNGSASDSSDFFATRPWAPIELFAFLEASTSLKQLSSYFETTRPDLSYIVQGADKKGAVSFEWATSGVKVRQPDKNGLLVATNAFFDPSWGQTPEDGVDYVVTRRTNLLALGEQGKGKFTPELMMKTISTPVEQGGAFRAPNLTSYEIVAQPETLTLWLRIPEYQDWVKVDLKQYFLR
ncbi:MAG: C45 family autoproteolytic acyltransferase/hydrolase [Candidatus Geothermincolia bacterium]